MLTKFLWAMTPGLASSAIKRYTAYNPHAYVLAKINNIDMKYWIQKYFRLNDYVIEKTESFFKNKKD